MAGDGITDEEAIAFWRKTKANVGSKFPKAVKETAEIALLGGALLVAWRFTGSWMLSALYWLLLVSFACRIGARIAFPKAYDSPGSLVALGLAATCLCTYVENLAIQSAADAALIQLQGERALKWLDAKRAQEAEGTRLFGELAGANCLDDEGVALEKVNRALCDRIRAKIRANDQSLDSSPSH